MKVYKQNTLEQDSICLIQVSKILQKIINNYNSLNEFAKQIEISSAYISKLINLKYKNPPSPKILQKIAEGSKGLTTYNELMQICGYGQTIEKTSIEQGAIEYLKEIVKRQESGWSLVEIVLNYIKKLERGDYILDTQENTKNKNLWHTTIIGKE
ncbi:MAG: helix-turn-helix transcriptional regulator [Clostridia bacterium]|nr:helix-turn-helix transcriptional regulator [Clostridia bacterium]